MNPKKLMLAIVIILLTLSFSSFFSHVVAETRSNLALDLVIVIDETGSMWNGQKSDEMGLRHDAAAALMGLCDAKYSRVAIIPFSDAKAEILESNQYLFRLLPVDIPGHQSNRDEMIKLLINEDVGKKNQTSNLFTFCQYTGGQTDLGSALNKAVDLLVKNYKGNKQVIVFLTDGEISLSAATEAQSEKMEKASAETFRSAYKLAQQKGIKIYMVGLNISAENSVLLKDAVEATDGRFELIQNKSAEKIPAIFNNFFMDMMGLEAATIKGGTVNVGNNKYKTTITIPNQSIAEANILVPVGSNGNVKITNPSGKTVKFDGVQCLKYSTTYFTLIKILNPQEVGNWEVEYYVSEKTPKALKGIEVNVIFSYDMTPEISAPSSLYKADMTSVDVRFCKPDGSYTEDENLYICSVSNDKKVNETFQIKGELTIQVKKANGTVKKKSGLTLTPYKDRFHFEFVLNDFYKTLNLTPNQGDVLEFQAHFQGAGIDMDTPAVSVPVENLAPVLIQDALEQQSTKLAGIQIHDPFRSDYNEEAVREIDLKTCVTDPDKEEIRFEYQSGQDAVFKLVSLENDILKLTTQNHTGETTLNILAKDSDGGETLISIPGSVTVIQETVRNQYHMEIERSDSVETNGTITFTAKLYDENGNQIKSANKLSLVDLSRLSILVTFEKDQTTQMESIAFHRKDQQDCFIASYDLSKHAASYQMQGDVYLKDIKLNNVTRPDIFSTENSAPVLKEKAELPSYDETIHDPLSEDAVYQAEWKIDLDVSELVEDKDGEAKVYRVESGKGVAASISDAGLLHIESSNQSCNTRVKVTVLDPEKAACEFEIPVVIRSIRQEIGRYHLRVINPGEGIAEGLDKRSNYEVSVKLADQEGNDVQDKDLPVWLSRLDTSALRLTFQSIGAQEETPVALQWTPDTSAQQLTASFTTGNVSGTYRISGSVSLKDDIKVEIPCDASGAYPIWTVGNIPPFLDSEYAKSLQTSFEIEPLLWRQKNENEMVIDLAVLFQDSATDTLTFYAADITGISPADFSDTPEGETESTVPETADLSLDDQWIQVYKSGKLAEKSLPLTFAQEKRADESEEEAGQPEETKEEKNAHVLILNNKTAGPHSFLLYAEDTDGQRILYHYEQNIISQKEEVICLLATVAAGIAVLFVLYEMVYWLVYRKKWTVKHGDVTIYMNNFATGVKMNFPRSGKKEMNLSALRITEGSESAVAGEIRRTAQCFKLRPGIGNTVIVRRVKRNKTKFDVTVGTTNANNRKKVNWPAGVSLKLSGKSEFVGKTVEAKRENAQQHLGISENRSALPNAATKGPKL